MDIAGLDGSRDSTYTTARLEIEPLVEAHALVLFDVLADPRIYEFMPTDPPVDIDALAARYRNLERRMSPDGAERWLNWAVRFRDGGPYLGRLEATVRPEAPTLIAYEFAPSCWGRGIGRESVGWLIGELAERYGVLEIEAEVDTRNAASIRLLEACGFERVRSTENADWFKGAPSHEYAYRLQSCAGSRHATPFR